MKISTLYILICWMLCFSNRICSQSSNTLHFISQTNFPSSITGASLNRYGQLHILTEQGVIYQFDTLGKAIKQFSIRGLNGGASLDASLTLRILAFSEPLQQAYWLDRLLGDITPIQLPEDYYYAALSSASNNGLWAYESQEIALHHLTNTGTVDIQIPLRASPATQQTPICSQIQARHDKIYAAFQGQGVAVSNSYGNYLHWIALDSLQSMAISEPYLYLFGPSTAYQYPLVGNQQSVPKPIHLPKGNWQQWCVYQRFFWGITANKIHFFKRLE